MTTKPLEPAYDPRLAEINLAIVCPMANEEATAAAFVAAVLAECDRRSFKSVTFLVVLDNKSKDGTREKLAELATRLPKLRVVWAPENRCIADAYVAGYRAALNAGSHWILEIDAGFSHHPKEILRFFDKMLEGYDCVFGSRFCNGGRIVESSASRYIISRGGTILSNLLLGTKLKDMTSGFELFTRSSLQYVMEKGIRSQGPFFQTEIKAYCRRFKIAEVPIQYRAASHRVGGAALRDSFSNLWRLFRLRRQGEL